MKSRRKEINKYKTRSENKQIESNFFLRTSGNKPFDLSKLRVTQRQSKVLKTNSQQPLPVISRQNIDLDLVIHKKTLINSKRIQKQKRDRRKIVLNIQQQIQGQIQQAKESVTNTEQESLDPKGSVVLEQYHAEQLDEGNSLKKKQKQCYGCYQIQRSKDNLSPIPIKFIETKQDQNRINQHKNQLDLKRQSQSIANLPKKTPFVFTHLKWRSRSQVFQVDKWKQKYGGSQFSRPNFKHLDFARRGLIAIMQRKFSQKNSQMSKKLNFMEKEYSQKMNYATMLSKQIAGVFEKKTEIKKKHQRLQQINNSERNLLAEQKYKTQNAEEILEEYKKEGVQLDNRRRIMMFNEAQDADLIQNTLEADRNLEEDEETSEEHILSQAQRQLKMTKKKWKLPSIQICSFNSTREQQEEERRKTTKLFNAQKMQRDWKEKPPKEIFLEKMMEQIPERWEHGQSRDISRQQVGTYMHLKQEQQLRQQIIRQIQQRRMAQIRKQQEELFGDMQEVRT